MAKNKILVIGHSVIDKIYYGNEFKTNPGGIYFSIKGFIATDRNCKVELLTEFTKENEKYFSPEYSYVKLIEGYYADKMPVNRLYIHRNKERDEIYEYIPNPLDISRINDFTIYNAIYINMISGFDITLEQLRHIRENFNGIIYLDIHTLSRGVFKNNKRKFRLIPDAEEWLKNVDFIQANDSEVKTLSTDLSFNELVKVFLEQNGRCFINTKGEKGLLAYYYENREIKFSKLTPQIVSDKQCVGCGDFFGASFLCNYLSFSNIQKALNNTLTNISEFISEEF